MPLHYRKDGGLDMRYASSRAAVSGASSSSGSNYTSSYTGRSGRSVSRVTPHTPPAKNPEVHYRKDGQLDMRYSSSKQAVLQGHTPPQSPASKAMQPQKSTPSMNNPDELHFTKSGNLDMRFKSSKEHVGNTNSVTRISNANNPEGLHFTKSGNLDMRFKSSKQLDSDSTYRTGKSKLGDTDDAGVLHFTKSGNLDMRYTSSREYLRVQAAARQEEKYVSAFDRVAEYHRKLNENDEFRQQLDIYKQEAVEPTLEPTLFCEATETAKNTDEQDIVKEFVFSKFKSTEELGRGTFGIVLKSQLPETNEPCAVKKLHLSQLTKKDKASFKKEIQVMSRLDHPNIIKIYGYCNDEHAIVMEFAPNNSVSFQLYFNENKRDEARMALGRTKKKIIFGIANGLNQIHKLGITHNDIKSANILLDKDFEAKICDFGLSHLRSKTSSTSSIRSDGQRGGTSAYMAPELLDFDVAPSESSEVYAFGILMNEIISETEPYCDDFPKFVGRGDFAAVHYAATGKRPLLPANMCAHFKELIEQCWATRHTDRPDLATILTQLSGQEFTIADSI
eukprot:m.1085605 g.1085605  ORF g.1085605 m.1085605 type:complete len:562 (-) comp24279_c0_seq39:4214-5899(-)